jgi:hypothetical protein
VPSFPLGAGPVGIEPDFGAGPVAILDFLDSLFLALAAAAFFAASLF